MSISYLNSLTPRNIVSGFVFNGVYDDILISSQITTRITANVNTDNHYTLLIEYSNDKVNVVSFETITVIFDYNKLLYLTPTSRYFKLTLTAISDINDLSIETIFKHAIVYQPINQISGFVFVDNLPEIQTISGNVSVNNFPAANGDVNIISSVPLEISNLGFTSNIIASVPLEISNLGFTSNIIASVELDVNVLTLPVVVLDTNIVSIDNTVTFLTQERPTTEVFFSTSAGNQGMLISASPKVIRNMSLNTTSSVIVYVYLYDLADVPTSANVPTFVFTIKDSNNVVFNPLDHYFQNGLGLRATTNYNGTTSPALNSVFVNMTLSD